MMSSSQSKEMATMPRDSNPRQKSISTNSGQHCDRKTRSRSAASFVDSLLPAVSSPSPKKIRLTETNSSPTSNDIDSDTMQPISTVSSIFAAMLTADEANMEKLEDTSGQSNGCQSVSPNLQSSGRSSAVGSYEEGSIAGPQSLTIDEEQIEGMKESGLNGTTVDPNGGNYYSCMHCNKYFWTETSLKHHCSLYHSEKSFVCEICGKAFRFRSNLAEHRSVHTSLKPYVCKFCGKSSRLKGNLTKHILKHHKKEQNAYIGKDDIIIKKGKKSIKDPAAVDFLEKSMIVLTTPTNTGCVSTTTVSSKQASTSVSTTSTTPAHQFNQSPTDLGSAAYQLLSMATKTETKPSSRNSAKRSASGQTSGTGGTPKNDGDIKSQRGLPNGKSTTQTKNNSRLAGSPSIGDVLGNDANCFPSFDHGNKFDFGDLFSMDSRNPARDVDAVFESLLGRSANYANAISTGEFGPSPKSALSTMPMASSNMSQTKSNGTGMGTRCQLCGKHFRKAANLAVHMSIKHNQAPPMQVLGLTESPPPSQAAVPTRNPTGPDFPTLKFPALTVDASQSKQSSHSISSFPTASTNPKPDSSSKSGQRPSASNSAATAGLLQIQNSFARPSLPLETTGQPSTLFPTPNFDAVNGLMTKCGVSKDLKEIRNVLQELKRGLPDVAKLDELLSALDARVDRLERQLETSVNTLYVLVQMQTDMNSAFCQFKHDVVQSLRSLKTQQTEGEDEEECDGVEEEEEEEGGEHGLVNGTMPCGVSGI